ERVRPVRSSAPLGRPRPGWHTPGLSREAAMTHVETHGSARPAPRGKSDWPFDVKPLSPVLGCEITGITLEDAVSPKLFAKIYEAFLDYELILFRDVDLPPATQ